MKAIMIVGLVCALFSGCAPSPTSKKTILKVNFGTDPPSLDPRKMHDNISSYIATMCFDGLTRINPEGEAVLSLAESCDISDDGLRYIFTLKEAKWSNGTLLTAYDFENTWKTLLDPSFPAPSALLFYCIKNAKQAKAGHVPVDTIGVKALDAKTLQVDLEYPHPHSFELFAGFYPYSDRVAAHNLAFFEKKEPHFLSLGPFYIESYQPQHKISLKKNPNYWDHQAVHLEGIEIFFVSDQNTELSMYEQGEIDWAGSPSSTLPIEALPTLKEREDFFSYPVPGLYYYVFNTTKPPFNNANIRKALSLAIDREALSQHVIEMNMDPATRLLPPASFPRALQTPDYPKARDYFEKGCAELGVTVDTFPSISLSYNAGVGMHFKLVQAIQQQWKEVLGINSQLVTLEWKVYLDALSHRNFQVARLGASSPCRDPAFFLELFAYPDSAHNHGGWHNIRFEKLFKQALYSVNANQRAALIQEAEDLFLEEMPIIPLFFYKGSCLRRANIQNVVLTNYHFDFKWAKIE